MIFRPTQLDGVFAIDLEPHRDSRGWFARTFCVEEFAAHGLNTEWVQCNVSHSDLRGTLRGIHFQAPPDPEAKLIRVVRGSIFAVVADLRTGRRSFGRWQCHRLSENDGTMLYVPPGCGFGFQTMADHTALFYQMSALYRPELATGVRWNDPDLGVPWPCPPTRISRRDAGLPGLREIAAVTA